MATQKIKVGDEVIALAGKDKGRTGNVKKLIKDKNRKVIKVLVEGRSRARLKGMPEAEDYLVGSFEDCEANTESNNEIDALMRSILNRFENYVKSHKKSRKK